MTLWPAPSNISTAKRVVGADPAANTEFSLTVPAGKSWQLIAVTVALAQGATQTPQPILVIDDGTNTLFEALGSTAVQAVSTTTQYTWAPGHALTGQIGAAAGVHAHAPLPLGLLLGPGYRVRSSTLGLGANSDYGVPGALVIEYG
jgi:hypothetical protein